MLKCEDSYSPWESSQPDEFVNQKDIEPDDDGSRPDLHDLARCPSQRNEADPLTLERQINKIVSILRAEASACDAPAVIAPSDPSVIAPACEVANEQNPRTTSKRHRKERQRKASKRPREPNDGEQTSKKRKVPAPSIAAEAETDYVRMCRHILESTNPLLEERSIRDLLRRVFVTEAAGWEEKLNSPDRAGFIESMCKTRNAFVRLPFCLLRFIDYLKTQEGRDVWERREANFRLMFGDTICRVLANRGAQAQSDEMIRQNQVFTQSLYDSFACLSFLMERGVRRRRNLCFLLMVVSCIEGRGVYHGRTANGLSMAHQCCRYMIDTLSRGYFPGDVGGRIGRAEKVLIATFGAISEAIYK